MPCDIQWKPHHVINFHVSWKLVWHLPLSALTVVPQHHLMNKRQICLKRSWETRAPHGRFIGTGPLNRLIMQSYYRHEWRKHSSERWQRSAQSHYLALVLNLAAFLLFSSFTSFSLLSVSVGFFVSLFRLPPHILSSMQRWHRLLLCKSWVNLMSLIRSVSQYWVSRTKTRPVNCMTE